MPRVAHSSYCCIGAKSIISEYERESDCSQRVSARSENLYLSDVCVSSVLVVGQHCKLQTEGLQKLSCIEAVVSCMANHVMCIG
jgi:hypothetical protein